MTNFIAIIGLLFLLNTPQQIYHVKDATTQELLCGVKVTIDTNVYYTDIHGAMQLPPNQKMNLSLISYKDTTVVGNKSVIYLTPVQ